MFIFDIDRWVEIWVTITRNKTRSLLTGFGVFWGILMLVILLGSGNGFKNGVLKNVDGFSTNSAFFFSERTGEPYKGYKKGRYWQMRNRDLETIRQRVKGVRYLSPMIMQWGGQNNVVRGQKAGTYNVRGVYSEYFNIDRREQHTDVQDAGTLHIPGTLLSAYYPDKPSSQNVRALPIL